ncbi:hypothetical protein PIB30_087146 [Stylosanthes scabra]|uniref:Uncharacterized protein n=1 Tax=Stylosanthes scabra TaxID=79078 RepID=A0ABU6VRT7_9FABA|nr:hypothetical protein [Stylosanthes scabra]
MLLVSFGASRYGSPPTPPPRDSSLDEPRQRDRSPRLEIRAPISSDDGTEDNAGTESGSPSYSSSGLYITSTSSSDAMFGRSYDSTDRSSSSSSDVTFDSDPHSPWPRSSISFSSYTSEDDLVDRYFVRTFPP